MIKIIKLDFTFNDIESELEFFKIIESDLSWAKVGLYIPDHIEKKRSTEEIEYYIENLKNTEKTPFQRKLHVESFSYDMSIKEKSKCFDFLRMKHRDIIIDSLLQ